jgi:hypothetical protein
MKSCFFTLLIPSVALGVNVMNMIDGIDIKYNQYLEVQNINDATNRYLDERAEIN